MTDGFNNELSEREKISVQEDIHLASPQEIDIIEKKRDTSHGNELRGIPFYKRAMDIAAALPALILLSPLFLVVAVLLKIESKAPVFFLSKRVGRGYKIFSLYKFRSMIPDAESKLKDLAHLNMYAAEPEVAESTLCTYCRAHNKQCDGDKLFNGTEEICEVLYLEQRKAEKAFNKIKNDPRITRLGSFLRNTSLDELPQLINILIGDMSLVGNRPLPLYEAEKLTTDKYSKRFLAPAGLTGLWQVTKRGTAEMSEEERIALDNEYADNYGFMMDMKIIFKTIPAMLQKESV